MSSRMRVTKGHSGNRRSHHGLKAPRLSKCANCGAYHQRHRACLECGSYRGKSIVNVKNKVAEEIVKKKEIKKNTDKTEVDKTAEKQAVKKDSPTGEKK